MYVRSPELPARVAAAMGPLYDASLNKFYFDEIFWAMLVAPLRGVGVAFELVRSRHDRLDRGRRGAGCRVCSSGVPLWLHNGRVPSYALVMWAGLLVCVLFAMRLLLFRS